MGVMTALEHRCSYLYGTENGLKGIFNVCHTQELKIILLNEILDEVCAALSIY